MAVTTISKKLYGETSGKLDIKCICSALNVYLRLFLGITALFVTHENCLRQMLKQDFYP